MEVSGPEWLAINARDVGVAGSNPVTQTTDFTSVFRDQTYDIIEPFRISHAPAACRDGLRTWPYEKPPTSLSWRSVCERA